MSAAPRSPEASSPASGAGSAPAPATSPAGSAEDPARAAEQAAVRSALQAAADRASARSSMDDPTTALRVPQDDATRMLRQLPEPEPRPDPRPGSDPEPDSAPEPSAARSTAPATPEAPQGPGAGSRQASGPGRAPQPAPGPSRAAAPGRAPAESGWDSAPPAQPWAPSRPPQRGPEAEPTRAMPAWSPPRAEPQAAPAQTPPQPPFTAQPPAPEGQADYPETTSEAMEVLATLNSRRSGPVRRALKRISLWGGLLCVLLVILAVIQLLRPLPGPTLKLTAAESFAFSGSAPALAWPVSGQATAEVSGLGSLGHTGSDNPVPIASVTKVMTAHLILKDHPLKPGDQGPQITVDKQAADEYAAAAASGESTAKVSTGEQITEYQALQMLLIPSANNIARLLGRWDAGTDAAFVTKMQAEAVALGMAKSTYTDPSGLQSTTRSTANDQLKLAGTVMLDPVFREIVGTASFTPPGDKITYNNNNLLQKNGVIGIKTGSSTAALGCLMWAAEQKVGGTTQTIIGVVLSQPAVNGVGYLPMVLANSKKVILSAEAALQSHTIAKKGDVVGYVDDGLGGRTPVVASKDVTVVGWGGLSVQVALSTPTGGVPHNAKAGTAVGTLQVGTGPTAQQIPVTLQSDLVVPSYQAKLTRLG